LNKQENRWIPLTVLRYELMFFIPENNTPKITINAITRMKQNFSRDQMEQHFLLQDSQ